MDANSQVPQDTPDRAAPLLLGLRKFKISSSILVWPAMVGYLVKTIILPRLPAIEADILAETFAWVMIIILGVVGPAGVRLSGGLVRVMR